MRLATFLGGWYLNKARRMLLLLTRSDGDMGCTTEAGVAMHLVAK